jgi:hypothetical protein
MMRPIGVGVLGSAAGILMAFVIFPGSWLTTAFLWPGILLLPVAGWLLPDGWAYRLSPDGGPSAAILVVVTIASVFWGVFSIAVWKAFFTGRGGVAHASRRGPVVEARPAAGPGCSTD